MPPSLKLRLSQLVLLAAFCGMALTGSLTAPFNTGPDEVAHFLVARFIAKTGRLPVSLTERAQAVYKSDLPPLFYLLVGLPAQTIELDSPPYIKIAQDNPRLQLVVGAENVVSWRALTTEDPLRSEVLLWYLGRWLTLQCGAASAVIIYTLLSHTFPGRPWLALSGTASLIFLPVYLKISGVISYEPLLGGLVAAYLLALFWWLQRPLQAWLSFVTSFLLGLACLAKYTPWPLLPLWLLLIVALGWRQQWPWRRIVGQLGLALTGLVATVGLWLGYTLAYFSRVTELGWLRGSLYALLASDGSDTTSLRLVNLLNEGHLNRESAITHDALGPWLWRMVDWGEGWLSWLLLGLVAFASVGLVRGWRTLTPNRRLWLLVLLGHLAALFSLPLARFWLTGQTSTGIAQHLVFPAGAIVLILTVQGLSVWLAPSRLATVLLLAALLAGVQSAFSLARSAEAPWPVPTVPWGEPEQVAASFGPISLLSDGYQVTEGSLLVTLFWRAEELMARDYWLALSLLDSSGQPVIRWTGQPLNGRYPTRAWFPGDRFRDQITLPLVGVADSLYKLQLQLLDEQGSAVTAAPFGLAEIDLALARRQAAKPNATPAYITKAVKLAHEQLTLRLWAAPGSGEPFARFGENAVVTVSVEPTGPAQFQLFLVGPDEERFEPVEQWGPVFYFQIAPGAPSGPYRFRLEQNPVSGTASWVETPPLLAVETEPRQFRLADGEITQSVEANFANYVNLLGYNLPQKEVQPGGALPLTLYWQARRTIGADLILVNRLLDGQGQVWGGRDRKAREVYSTMLWAPGEIVSDSFAIQVAAQTPPGNYTIFVGLYLPVGEAPVSLPLVQGGQLGEETSIKIGPVWVGPAAAESAATGADH